MNGRYITLHFSLNRYKHIGVLNAAFAVKNMVKVDDSNATTTSDSTSSLLNTSALKEAENLLHLVLSSTSHHPTASALFMDEMASITLRDGLNARIQVRHCCFFLHSLLMQNMIVWGIH